MRERGERPAEQSPPPAVEDQRPSIPVPIDWMKLTDSERAEILTTVLFDWVPAMVRSYALKDRVVPGCWYLHEEMIHELLALFQYRNQMQFNAAAGAPPSAPIDFQYQLSLWKMRMRDLTGDAGCTSSQHIPGTISRWADEKRGWAQWSVAAEEFASELAAEPDETGIELSGEAS